MLGVGMPSPTAEAKVTVPWQQQKVIRTRAGQSRSSQAPSPEVTEESREGGSQGPARAAGLNLGASHSPCETSGTLTSPSVFCSSKVGGWLCLRFGDVRVKGVSANQAGWCLAP